jgi:hypothetical protein
VDEAFTAVARTLIKGSGVVPRKASVSLNPSAAAGKKRGCNV